MESAGDLFSRLPSLDSNMTNLNRCQQGGLFLSGRQTSNSSLLLIPLPETSHFHRTLSGTVDIWVYLSITVWQNCTHAWLSYNSEPILHPSNSSLVLDSWGTKSWIPNYIAKSTYSRRRGPMEGLPRSMPVCSANHTVVVEK